MGEEKHGDGVGATQSAAMAPVHIDGWTLWHDGANDWARVLDIGVEAEMARPRDIRRVAVGLVADGAAAVDGGGAARFIADVKRAKTVRKKAFGGARCARAIIRAEIVVVPNGDHGGTQETIELYANAEAATLIAMRLRTPKAIQVQCAIAHIFVELMRGRRGALPEGALSRDGVQKLHIQYSVRLSTSETAKMAAQAEVERLREDARRAREDLRRALESGSSWILPGEADELKRLMYEARDLRVALYGESIRSAYAKVLRKTVPGCHERGQRLKRLEKSRVGGAFASIEATLSELRAQAIVKGIIAKPARRRRQKIVDRTLNIFGGWDAPARPANAN